MITLLQILVPLAFLTQDNKIRNFKHIINILTITYNASVHYGEKSVNPFPFVSSDQEHLQI